MPFRVPWRPASAPEGSSWLWAWLWEAAVLEPVCFRRVSSFWNGPTKRRCSNLPTHPTTRFRASASGNCGRFPHFLRPQSHSCQLRKSKTFKSAQRFQRNEKKLTHFEVLPARIARGSPRDSRRRRFFACRSDIDDIAVAVVINDETASAFTCRLFVIFAVTGGCGSPFKVLVGIILVFRSAQVVQFARLFLLPRTRRNDVAVVVTGRHPLATHRTRRRSRHFAGFTIFTSRSFWD